MIDLRTMQPDQWDEVAELICLGTNYWYQTHGMGPIFSNGPESARLFCQVYEALDPGCCVVAVNSNSDKIVGSCFYHPRRTHVSLGIMNVHPNYFGAGVARKLLAFVLQEASECSLPVRLVSSAMNLDSFSLYNRAGFVPRVAYQDMYVQVPETGLVSEPPKDLVRVRAATLDDAAAIADLEFELSGVYRKKDFEFFIRNESGIWKTVVYQSEDGTIEGCLVSVNHPGSNMIGPGVARDSSTMKPLLYEQLNLNAGSSPVLLVPVQHRELVDQAYAWGAKNCELHFSQVLGEYQEVSGVILPTFMPETC